MRYLRRGLEWAWLRFDGLRSQTAQTTAEYALVLLGAAAVALVLIAWAKGDDNGIKQFFQHIMDNLKKAADK